MTAKVRVGILFGGESAEHEISILSARNVLAALDARQFEPVLIGIDKHGAWTLQDPQTLLQSTSDPRLARIEPGPAVQRTPASKQLTGSDQGAISAMTGAISAMTGAISGKGALTAGIAAGVDVDVVFPVLHGTLGEDGCVQGLLEVAGIPYVGAGVLGSAIGMDKDVMKRLLRDAGIPVANFRTLHKDRFDADPANASEEVAELGFPLFTKPANAGSSVGIRKVRSREGLGEAIRYAFRFDSKVICEAAVSGREVEVAVLGGRPPIASVAGEIIVEHPDGFYSYDAKYIDEHGARLEAPAKLSAEEQSRIQALALRTFEVLECEGMARVDFFLQADGTLLVNEINTIPGFTAISMYPRLWSLSGIGATELVTRLIALALERGEQRAAIRAALASRPAQG